MVFVEFWFTFKADALVKLDVINEFDLKKDSAFNSFAEDNCESLEEFHMLFEVPTEL